jgi:hypothetical protein
MNATIRFAFAAAVAGLAAGPGIAQPALAEPGGDDRASYSYVRTLEGRATLASSRRAPGEEVGLHEPLQRGDQIQVEWDARLEVVLADRSLLRVAGGSSLRLTQIAFSADGADRTTVLEVERGEILLDVGEDALGDELPEIRTAQGTIFVHQPGLYRILLSATGDLQVTVREGYAELLTENGSTVIRGGEEAWTGGDRWDSVQVATAGPRGALETWGEELERDARRATNRELRVEPHLAYSAASLDDYGSWVYLDASWYWRPRVATGWRPYWDGRWSWTPSGLTWASYEPWGWVPYHYGSWRLVPGYGWIWAPGSVYSPAWVYWNISPSWTGWCPVGYYTHHYRGYWNTGFRFGIYGWTGGSWGIYSDWAFLPSNRLLHRRNHSWRRTGGHLGRTESPDVPRGVLTTDTSGLPRERFERPEELVRDLERRGSRRGEGGSALAEVTDFVARRPALPAATERAVRRDPVDRTGGRRASPLDPGAPAVEARRERPEIAGWQERQPVDRRAGGGPGRSGPTETPGASARLGGGFGSERAGEAGTPRTGRSDRMPNATPTPERRIRIPSRPLDDGVRGGGASQRPPAAMPPDASDRQGWRRTGGNPASADGTGTDASARRPPVTSGRVERWTGGPAATPRSSGAAATPRSGEPISRVVDGVRRGTPEPGSARFFDGPPGAVAAPRAPTAGVTPGSPGHRTPTAATPPAGWRGAPSGVPRATAPPGAARPATVSPPRASTPPRGSAPPPTARQAPAQRGGSTASSGNRGSSGDSGAARAQSSGGSNRGQSSESSSPPPRRGKPPAAGD